MTQPIIEPWPDHDRRLAAGAAGLLETFNGAGVLEAGDVHVAARVGDLGGETDESVLLAVALAVRGVRHGSVCIDLTTVPELAGDLPWPDAVAWAAALAASPLVTAGAVRVEGTLVYLDRYQRLESQVCDDLLARVGAREVDERALAAALERVQRGHFSAEQRTATERACRQSTTVLTGGPGTGKTTSVVRLLGLLQTPAVEEGKPLRIRLAAPTGKAAARLSESIGKAVRELPVSVPVREAIPTDVSTLHRLLGSRPDSRNFIHHRDKPLELDVLVVDEASMIDLEMMACLLDALPRQARLILLGDKDQLASVDAGSVLGDLCRNAEAGGYSEQTVAWLEAHSGESVSAPGLQTAVGAGDPLAQQTVMLRYSRRFDAQQGIGRLAKLVNEKNAAEARSLLDQQLPQLFNLKLRGEHDAALTELIINGKGDAPGYRHYLEQLRDQRPAKDTPWDSSLWAGWAGKVLGAFDEFRLLCALRRGPWGVEGLNQRVAAELRRCELLSGDQGWYEGRPVLVTRNDYSLSLMNGDIGIALWVPGPAAERVLRVAFPRNDGSGGVRFVMPSRLVEVETVFAMTVHKSQGSEFNHTALVLPDALNPVLTKELLYTAITRAKQWFSLVEASPGVFEGAVSRNVQRTSGLALQLQDELAKLQRT